jgi:hypothetical protein
MDSSHTYPCGNPTPLQQLEQLTTEASRAMRTLRGGAREGTTGPSSNHRRPTSYPSDHLVLSPTSHQSAVQAQAEPSQIVAAQVQKIRSKNQALIAASAKQRRDALHSLAQAKATSRSTLPFSLTTTLPIPYDVADADMPFRAIENERDRHRRARAQHDEQRRQKRQTAQEALVGRLQLSNARAAAGTPLAPAAGPMPSASAIGEAPPPQSSLLVRDLVEKQFAQWSDHRLAEQRRLEQEEKMSKLQLDLHHMRQDRELKLRRTLMEKQLHEWMRTQKQRLVLRTCREASATGAAVAAAAAAAGDTMPWVGSDQHHHHSQAESGSRGLFAQQQQQQPVGVGPSASFTGTGVSAAERMASADAAQIADRLRRENEELRQQKLRVLQQMEDERALFLKRQHQALQHQQTEEATARKAEELAHQLQRHFQSELVKTRT